MNPIVTVTIIEYDSRPITVVGAVKSPVTFQAMGDVILLDAIFRAQGLTVDAGSEILISSQAPGPDGKETTLSRRVPVRGLLDNTDPALNVQLHGGELVRVPEAGRVFVVGDVKRSGSYLITDGSQSGIMKALVLSEELEVGGKRREKPSPVSSNASHFLRAAQHVHMSTGHQQYFPENQIEVVRKYAASHHMEIVRDFSDHGRSGVDIADHEGLNLLMLDMEDQHFDFSAMFTTSAAGDASRMLMKAPTTTMCSNERAFVFTIAPNSWRTTAPCRRPFSKA